MPDAPATAFVPPGSADPAASGNVLVVDDEVKALFAALQGIVDSPPSQGGGDPPAGIEDRVEVLEQQMVTTIEALNAAADTIQTLTAALNSQQGQIAQLSTQNGELSDALDAAEDRLDTAEAALGALSDADDALDARVTTLEDVGVGTGDPQHEARIGALETRADDADAERAALAARADDVDLDLDQANDDLDALEASGTALGVRVTDVEDAVEDIQNNGVPGAISQAFADGRYLQQSGQKRLTAVEAIYEDEAAALPDPNPEGVHYVVIPGNAPA